MSKPAIICVDDERVILDTLITQLESHFGDKFDYEVANSGEEALELIESLIHEEQNIAVLISDQLMPGMKGDELLIRAHKLIPQTIKILLTGQASADAVGRAVNKANLYRYIAKPWDKTDLLLTIEEATKSYLLNFQVAQKTQILESLFYGFTEIGKVNSLNETYNKLCELAAEYTSSERALLLTIKNGHYDSIYIYNRSENSSKNFSPLVISQIIDTQKHLIIANCNVQPWGSDQYVTEFKPKSILAIPLLSNSVLIGVFCLESYSKYDFFNKQALDFMQLFTFEAAISIEKGELYENLELKVNQRTEELNEQKTLIEEINKDLQDSIRYASRILEASLPNVRKFYRFFPDSIIYSSPKNVVSGDFYWFHINEDTIYFAVCDCTGHGVPGAILSILGSNIMSNIIELNPFLKPSQILKEINLNFIKVLNKNNTPTTLDGMDIALFSFDKSTHKLIYAGANRPFYYVKNGEIIESKSDKCSIGANTPTDYSFTDNEFILEKDDMIFAFSDGLTDQFDEMDEKKITSKKLRAAISENYQKSIKEISEIILSDFNDWKGMNEQTDDVLLLALKI